ncbi:PP2C family protein-serine/threonine phosphatase [uncultured Jatrophihabitans sp.]|uniref:PP2C family protein-serine/threonine phosphatase n=1 Tax=uncultured Jatrophihabitans sp. TaxID=1610747 RepID=UPI0035C976C2
MIVSSRRPARASILEEAEAASPVDAVDAVTGQLAVDLDARHVGFLIADLSGRALVRLGVPGESKSSHERGLGSETADSLPFTDPIIEGVLREQHGTAFAEGDGWRVLAPVTQRGEVIGLLEVLLANEPSAQTIEQISQVAHTLAFVVIVNRRHTDLFEWGQRSTPFSLSAEIQRRVLPAALTCEAGSFTLSGWLEPAATIAGDTFDYSLDRDTLHLSITDAMGHGVSSALTATVCVSSLRNTRRTGGSLLEQAAGADEAVRTYARNAFCTGVLGRLALRTGLLDLVNAGHVLPLRVREDHVEEIELPVDLPFGLNADCAYRSTSIALEPGDRLVFVTDGMLERNAAAIDVAAILLQTRHEHPRETTRHLADAVVQTAGQTLADDATILVLDWHGAHGQRRESHAGAN